MYNDTTLRIILCNILIQFNWFNWMCNCSYLCKMCAKLQRLMLYLQRSTSMLVPAVWKDNAAVSSLLEERGCPARFQRCLHYTCTFTRGKEIGRHVTTTRALITTLHSPGRSLPGFFLTASPSTFNTTCCQRGSVALERSVGQLIWCSLHFGCKKKCPEHNVDLYTSFMDLTEA